MASLNRVMLIGNLGADPEVRTTAGGGDVANFRVALTETWKDQGGQKHERTEWATVVAWRGLASIAARFLRKGSKVYVEGKLQTRSWEDRNGGGKRYATEVLAETMILLDGRPEAPQDQPPRRREKAKEGADHGSQDQQDDDLPF